MSVATRITLGSVAAAALLVAAVPAGWAHPTGAGAGTTVLVLTAKDLPGWKAGQSQAIVSGDALATIDPRTAAPTRDRVLDGRIASFAKSKTIVTSGAFVTSSPAAARRVVRRVLSAPSTGGAGPRRRIVIGDGGAVGIAEGSLQSIVDLIWSSGRYVIEIGATSLGAKSALSQAQVLVLARKVQARVALAG